MRFPCGGGLGWFELICLAVLILAISIDEIHKKGSGIEEVALPNQYYFSQGILSEFLQMLSEKWNYLARTWIRKQAARTPPPPQPEEAPILWEVERPRLNRKASNSGQPQEDGYFNFFEQALTGNGKHYDQTPSSTITGEGSRVVIQGFKRSPEEQFLSPVINATVRDAPSIPPKACLHCGQIYAPKVAWQKFCGPDCKENFHAARHGGQVFNPAKYRRNK